MSSARSHMRLLPVAALFVFILPVVTSMKCWSKAGNDFMDVRCEEKCAQGQCPVFCFCDKTDAVDTCTVPGAISNGKLTVLETASPGTTLFTIQVTGGERWEFTVGRTSEVDGSRLSGLRGYFKLSHIGSTYEMIVNETPDLEKIFKDYHIELTSLILVFTCKKRGLPDEKYEVLLEVKPVNEFAPSFSPSLYYFRIPENTKVGTEVFSVSHFTEDRDVNPATNELSSYGLWEYAPDIRHDGRAYFRMPNVQNGSVFLKKRLDYETLKAIDSDQLHLNVSASDIHGLKTFATVTIEVSDEDDLPPEFFHPGCPVVVNKVKPCLVSYDAFASLYYVGEIEDIQPGKIQARDMDGLNYRILFSLERGPGQDIESSRKFRINETTGAIFVTSAFRRKTQVNLVVVATENSTAAKTTQAPLSVLVDTRRALTTGRLDSSNQSEDKEEVGLLMKILVGILSAAVLALLISLLVVLVKSAKRAHSRCSVHPLNPSGPPSSYHVSQHTDDINFQDTSRHDLAPTGSFFGQGSTHSAPVSSNPEGPFDLYVNSQSALSVSNQGLEPRNGRPRRLRSKGDDLTSGGEEGENANILEPKQPRTADSQGRSIRSLQEYNATDLASDGYSETGSADNSFDQEDYRMNLRQHKTQTADSVEISYNQSPDFTHAQSSTPLSKCSDETLTPRDDSIYQDDVGNEVYPNDSDVFHKSRDVYRNDNTVNRNNRDVGPKTFGTAVDKKLPINVSADSGSFMLQQPVHPETNRCNVLSILPPESKSDGGEDPLPVGTGQYEAIPQTPVAVRPALLAQPGIEISPHSAVREESEECTAKIKRRKNEIIHPREAKRRLSLSRLEQVNYHTTVSEAVENVAHRSSALRSRSFKRSETEPDFGEIVENTVGKRRTKSCSLERQAQRLGRHEATRSYTSYSDGRIQNKYKNRSRGKFQHDEGAILLRNKDQNKGMFQDTHSRDWNNPSDSCRLTTIRRNGDQHPTFDPENGYQASALLGNSNIETLTPSQLGKLPGLRHTTRKTVVLDQWHRQPYMLLKHKRLSQSHIAEPNIPGHEQFVKRKIIGQDNVRNEQPRDERQIDRHRQKKKSEHGQKRTENQQEERQTRIDNSHVERQQPSPAQTPQRLSTAGSRRSDSGRSRPQHNCLGRGNSDCFSSPGHTLPTAQSGQDAAPQESAQTTAGEQVKESSDKH
ncbi:uncharacterized protein LOC101852551 [Aplysia californica]|uniref:Uncharacterized protein LOC101852551 n=1 Tax=Aplysia californica TaxID=6500 RepID=A0ABM1VVM3_APLCA|nr:uncharacterized protein LOC101852551 [Aplysia californica]